jgi:hypothetical protein
MTETETGLGLLLSLWLPDRFVVTECLNEKGHTYRDREHETHIFLRGMVTVVTVIETGIAEADVVGYATVKENVVQEGGTQQTVTVDHKTEALPEGMNA